MLKEISIISFSPECDPYLVIESFMDGRDYYLIHDNRQRFHKDDHSFCFDSKKEPRDHYHDFHADFCGYLSDAVVVVCFENFSTCNTDSWHTFLGFLRGECVRDARADWTIYTIDSLPRPDIPCLFYVDEEENYRCNVKLTFDILTQRVQKRLNPKWTEWKIN